MLSAALASTRVGVLNQGWALALQPIDLVDTTNLACPVEAMSPDRVKGWLFSSTLLCRRAPADAKLQAGSSKGDNEILAIGQHGLEAARLRSSSELSTAQLGEVALCPSSSIQVPWSKCEIPRLHIPPRLTLGIVAVMP